MKNWREKGRMIRSKEKENFKQAGRKTACFIHMTFQVMTLLMPSTFGIWQEKEHKDQAKDHKVPDRMLVMLVMMMFQVMTILTFFLHYNFFYLK